MIFKIYFLCYYIIIGIIGGCMNEFNILNTYLKEVISNLKIDENLKSLENEKQQALDNIALIPNNLEKIDIKYIYEIYSEVYVQDELEEKYETFLEIISFSKYFSSNETQIQTCLNYLDDLRILLINKIEKINKTILNTKITNKNKLDLCNKYLDYFNEHGLTKNLSLKELEEFIDFLKNSSLDKEIVYNLIYQVTIDNTITKENINNDTKDIEGVNEEVIEVIDEELDVNKEKEELEVDVEIEFEDFNTADYELINDFIDEYNSLSLDDKKLIDSISLTYQVYGDETLDSFVCQFSNLEKVYYSKIKNLKDEYDLFLSAKNEDINIDDLELKTFIFEELDYHKNNIMKLVSEIVSLKNKIDNLKNEVKEENKNELEIDNSKSKNLVFLTPVLKDLKMFSQASCELNLRKKLYNMLNKLENNEELTREAYAGLKTIIEVKMATSGGGAIRLFCRYINNNIVVILLGIEGKQKHFQFRNTITTRTKSDEYSKLIEVLTRGTDENIQEILDDYKEVRNEFFKIFNQEVYNPNEDKLEESSSKSRK